MEDGQGVQKSDGSGYTYPPLWGANSYNFGAGLFRLSRFAGYVRANMPFGATYERPMLSDEESWDVAAYVNSLGSTKKGSFSRLARYFQKANGSSIWPLF